MSEAEATAGSRPSGWQVALRWGLLVLVLAGFVWAVGDRWSDVRSSLGKVPPWSLVAAWALATVGLIGPWRAWDAVVADLGSRVPPRPSAQIFFVGQLGKYVPGAVWPVLVQMRLGRAVGMSRTRVALSFVVTLVIGVATGLVVGCLVVPALLDEGYAVAWLLLLLVPVAVVALLPSVLSRLVRLLLRLLRRPDSAVALSRAGVLRAIRGTCTFWFVGGLHLWLLAVELGADPVPSLFAAIGALALGVSLGPLVVVLPAGAGLREAVLVAGLSTVLPVPDAVAAALLSRAVMVLGDGVLALIAFLVNRRGSSEGRVPDAAP